MTSPKSSPTSEKSLNVPNAITLSRLVLSFVLFALIQSEKYWLWAAGLFVFAALHQTVRIWSELTDQEEQHRLDTTRDVDLNLAWAVHRWASGRGLADVLGSQQAGELSAGDFVRWCRQIIDLLGQIQSAAAESGDDALRRSASAAIEGVRRGVVANSVG